MEVTSGESVENEFSNNVNIPGNVSDLKTENERSTISCDIDVDSTNSEVILHNNVSKSSSCEDNIEVTSKINKEIGKEIVNDIDKIDVTVESDNINKQNSFEVMTDSQEEIKASNTEVLKTEIISNCNNSFKISDEVSDKELKTLQHSEKLNLNVQSMNEDKANLSVNEEDVATKTLEESQSENNAFTKCQDELESGTEDSESDSNCNESDDDSSSDESEKKSSDDENESSDEDLLENVKPSNNKCDNKNNQKKKKIGAKYKHELDIEDLPPIEDLHITVLEDECEPLGTVYSIVNQLVVVQSLPNRPALNLDSLLFKKDGHCLGEIFDVFGPVKTPFYTIRFNSNKDIEDKGIEKGQTVYCAPQTPYTKYVFVYQLMQQKGSDASWRHNYEVPDAYKDYSDDEQEKRAQRKNQQKSRGRPSGLSNNPNPQKNLRVKKEFTHNYDKYTGNEWYKARVNELNQFNRSNKHQNFNRHHSTPGSSQQNYNSFNQNQNFEQIPSSPFAAMPPPLLRPPTPISWHRPQTDSNLPTGLPTVDRPQMSFPSPNSFNGHQYNQFQQPYEKLNMNPNFTNPMPPFSNRNPQPSPPWMQNPCIRNQIPFRIDNTRRTDLIPPQPLVKPNIRPMPPTLPPNFFTQPPPGPLPPPGPPHPHY